MEHRAFDLVRSNRATEARSLLFSEEYEQQKDVYTKGMAQVTAFLTAEVNASRQSTQKRGVNDALLEGGAALVLLAGWFIVLRLLGRWQTALDEASLELADDAKEVAELNTGLDQKVSARTKELEASRIAALNLMEDAVEVRKATEAVNTELKQQIARRQQAEESQARLAMAVWSTRRKIL